MAAGGASPKIWRDYVWLAFFVICAAGMILVDGVSHYPKWLYEPKDAPLHFLQIIRDWYLGMFNDPYIQEGKAPNWIAPFVFLEFVFLFPTAVYAIFRLSQKQGTTGPLELLLLVYGLDMAVSTYLCINDIALWDPVEYPTAVKNAFIYQIYGPYVVLPGLLFVDMYSRLLARFKTTDMVKKTQ